MDFPFKAERRDRFARNLSVIPFRVLAKRRSPGLVNYITTLCYLALPAAFTQPGDHLSAESCT